MKKNLRDYILSRLGPSGLRLELVNRLENLCSLSGQPMSPSLQSWMTSTFGLEMTRVVQDYATLNPNRLSPELQTRIDRIFPANQRLDFKSLFSTSCAPPPSQFWFGQLVDSFGFPGFQPGMVGDWTLELNSVSYPAFDWATMMGTIGGNAFNYSTSGSLLNYYIFNYIGPYAPPTLNGFDGDGNPISVSFNPYGSTTYCYSGTWSPTPGTAIELYDGLYIGSLDIPQTPPFVAVLADPSDPSTQPTLEYIFKQIHGPQTTVSYTEVVPGTAEIIVNNIYDLGSGFTLRDLPGINVLTALQVPCP